MGAGCKGEGLRVSAEAHTSFGVPHLFMCVSVMDDLGHLKEPTDLFSE